MKTFFPGDVPELRILGRNVTGAGCGRPLALFWTASGFECRLKTSELWVELESSYGIYEPWVSVRLNGSQIARFMVEKGRRWYCLFRNFPAEKENTVQLLKDTQAMSGDQEHMLLVHAVRTAGDAVFLPLPSNRTVIEFAGDSITTGEGLAGAPGEMDWLSSWMATDADYARITAGLLNADFRIVSQSGWGIVTGWDNNIHSNIPQYYRQICGLVPGELYERLGAHGAYDFDAAPADVVVINLGTNDAGAFSQPEWKDPSDGKTYRMNLDENGKPEADDARKVAGGVKSFLNVVRECNPAAYIIWCWGMCSIPALAPCIAQAVTDYAAESGDGRASVLELPSMDAERDDERGSRCHPGPVTHRRAAEKLAAYIGALGI
ncbi:MAG TPA: GDSL family lipase [Treponema sp.]|nr:GDSL family lipase [Treponema sp.]